jgi:hypothetical protein
MRAMSLLPRAATLLLLATTATSCTVFAPSAEEIRGCGDPECTPPPPSPALAHWLALNRGGFCLDSFKKVVPLCTSEDPSFSNPNDEGNFCFENTRVGRDRLRRTYPDGIAIDLGVHWDGARGGHFLTLGSSDALLFTCDPDVRGRRIVLGVDDDGALFAEGPVAPRIRSRAPIERGTHLLSYRVSAEAQSLFLDGARVAHGPGTGGVVVEFPERWSPGFVLGASNQRWWACTHGAPSRWLRSAPFFVHLKDDARDHTFSLPAATEAGPSTVLRFDAAGVRDTTWLPSHGVGSATWTEKDRVLRAGRAFGARWQADVWAHCLEP